MQSNLWMRPALQISEAVLLPALPRRSFLNGIRFLDQTAETTVESFQPVPAGGMDCATLALSTYVRPRGSMAGRGVLRAAGVNLSPDGQFARPMYAGPGRSLPMARRMRVL